MLKTQICLTRPQCVKAKYFALGKSVKSISKVYSHSFPNPWREYLLQFFILKDSLLILLFPSNMLKHKCFSYLSEIVDLV